jgi:hypothetical protein
MGRCGRLTVATGVDGAKLDTGFYLRECLFPRVDSALKRRNVSQVEVDIRTAAGPSRLNVRHVYAADADDALQTHALHYPGEHIVSMQRGDGLS